MGTTVGSVESVRYRIVPCTRITVARKYITTYVITNLNCELVTHQTKLAIYIFFYTHLHFAICRHEI